MKTKSVFFLFLSFLLFSGFQLSCSEEKTWDNLIKNGRKAFFENPTLAESYYIQALQKAQEIPNNDQQLEATFFKLGMLYQYKGNFSKSELYYGKALVLKEKESGPDSSSVATTLNNLAAVHIRQGNLAKGQMLLDRGLAIWSKLEDLNNRVAVTSLTLQAIVFRDEGKFRESEQYFQQALDLSQTVKGVDRGLLLDHWGVLYERQGKTKEAEDLYKQAIQFHEDSYGPENSELAKSLTFLGSLQVKQGELEKAEANLKKAINIQETIFGEAHPDLIITLENYGKLLGLQQQNKQVANVEARIESMRSILVDESEK